MNIRVSGCALIREVILGGIIASAIGVNGPAQSATAELSGTVRDQRGTGLAGVQLLLVEIQTGWQRQAVSRSDGAYRFASLKPSFYRLQVELSGFEVRTIPRLSLGAGETANLDLVLGVSPLQQEVTVEAGPSIVETERSSQSTSVEGVQISALPIDGRDYLRFALLTPGVSGPSTLIAERAVQAPTSGLSFSGQDPRSASIRIDGVDNLDDISNAPRSTLSQEAIQEFRVSRGGYSAARGGARGGVIDIVTKSGGNQFHGSAFGFLRDQSLDARNTFDKRIAPGSEAGFERQQFGVALGGPLKRNRTFFFAAYEGQLRDESLLVTFLDDRSVFQPTSSQFELFGFLGQVPDPRLKGLAASLIDSTSGALWTLPSTFPRTLDLFESESGAFPFSSDLHTFSQRLDHQESGSNQLFGRLSLTDYVNDNTDFGALEGVTNGVRFDVRDLAVVVGDLHVFSPLTLNEFRFQYAPRDLQVLTNDPQGPEVALAGVAEFGREFLNPTRYQADLWELDNRFSWIRGRHSFAIGGDLEIVQRRGEAEVFLGGQFVFGEAIPMGAVLDNLVGPGTTQVLATQLATPVSEGGLGRPDLASNLQDPLTPVQAFNFGLPITYFQGFGDPSTNVPITRLAAYFLDNWQAADRLTLNLGVRYDTSWRTETLNLVSQTAPFAFSAGAVNDHDNIAPRIGLAWRPWGGDHFTLRAGYGLYYQNGYGALEVTSSVLSGQISQVFLPLTGLPGLAVTAADIWGYMLSTGASGREALEHFGIPPGVTPSIILPGDPSLEDAYSHQAGLGAALALDRDLSLELDYLLNRGLHLIRSRDVNVRATAPGTFAFPGQDPRFIQVPVMESSGNSIYHGLTASLRKRFSRGYGFLCSYTLGKAIDDTTDFIIELGPQDQTDLRAERALSSFDQRHRLVVSGILQTPRRISWDPKWLGALAANWSIAPIVTWGSGRPFNLLSGFDRNGDTHEETDRPLLRDGSSVGRNTGRGPGFFAADIKLARSFGLSAKDARLEFSAEFFNLLNHVNYSQINSVLGNRVLPSGDLTGSSSIPANQPLGFTSAFDPRRIQLGVRLVF